MGLRRLFERDKTRRGPGDKPEECKVGAVQEIEDEGVRRKGHSEGDWSGDHWGFRTNLDWNKKGLGSSGLLLLLLASLLLCSPVVKGGGMSDGGGITLHLSSGGGGGGGMVARVPRSHLVKPRHGKPVRRSRGKGGAGAKAASEGGAAAAPNLALRGGGGTGGAAKGPPRKKTSEKKAAYNDDELDFLGGSKPRMGKPGGGGGAGAGMARPWERVPDKKEVKEAQPLEGEAVAVNKGLSKVHRTMPRAVNRSDDKTFSAGSFGDERLLLDEGLVENIMHKFNASQLTHVQRGAIPALMRGADVLMKARTGTGKTLAYLVPVVQNLLARPEKIDRSHGTYAVVIVPTRELALQVHDVLAQLARPFHWIVPGILVGGEKKKAEKARLRKGLSVVVGTPGRLSDHVSTTQCWDLTRAQFLILDEADRLMDMGFERDITRICRHVKESRSKSIKTRMQSVLVSATLDSKVRSLASASLTTPTIVSDELMGDAAVDANDDGDDEVRKYEIPSKLRQHYMSVQCKRRLVTLCAILRSKSIPTDAPFKAIVFASSIAEVTFLHHMLGRAALPEQWARDKGDKDVEYDSDDMEAEEEATTALLSLPIYRLHGDMPQQERTQTFFSFTGSRRGVLICTDVAARGLDFPKIDWIVQYDPPRDVEEYVHRVGRTARMTTEGDAMLFLMPHEEPYLDTLAQHNIKLKTMSESEARRVLGASRANAPSQKADEDFMSLQRGLEDIVATSPEASDHARYGYMAFIRAYSTYGKTLKRIFNPKMLHLGHVAASFALREQPAKIKDAQRRAKEKDVDHRPGGRFAKQGGERKRGREAKKLTPNKRIKVLRDGTIPGYDADKKLGLSAV